MQSIRRMSYCCVLSKHAATRLTTTTISVMQRV
ncbi:Uncharacterised protein [Vibrio cholerae]|nr:Uncharacterised protein [Vibrio cholerae]